MKGFILLIVAIIAVLLLGGAAAMVVFHDTSDESDTVSDVVDKVSSIASGDSDSGSSDESVVDKVSDIVKEEVKFNAQNGEGYYREVTYSDGGFRQYDSESGELIGSSYDSDQDKLPSME